MRYVQQIYSTKTKTKFHNPQRRKNPETGCAQQKQQKQLILIDKKNILTYRFQQRQRIQPDFIIETMRTLIRTMYNGANTKIRKLLFKIKKIDTGFRD